MIPDTTTALAADAASPPLFRAPYAPPDEAMAAELLREAARARDAERRIDAYARRLIEGIRARTGGVGGVGGFPPAHLLSTKEGGGPLGAAGGPPWGARAPPAGPR